MGTTPVKGMRYPDLSQLGMGPDDFNKMVYDLDGAYTAEDANRKAALFRNRAMISNGAINGSAVKNTWLTALFDTVVYDTAGMANLGTNNDRLTCKAQGAYLVTFAMQIQQSSALGANSATWAAISKNGITTAADPNFSIHQYSGSQVNVNFLMAAAWTVFQLNVNDYVGGRVTWTGTPAGPFVTDYCQLTMLQLNST